MCTDGGGKERGGRDIGGRARHCDGAAPQAAGRSSRRQRFCAQRASAQGASKPAHLCSVQLHSLKPLPLQNTPSCFRSMPETRKCCCCRRLCRAARCSGGRCRRGSHRRASGDAARWTGDCLPSSVCEGLDVMLGADPNGHVICPGWLEMVQSAD